MAASDGNVVGCFEVPSYFNGLLFDPDMKLLKCKDLGAHCVSLYTGNGRALYYDHDIPLTARNFIDWKVEGEDNWLLIDKFPKPEALCNEILCSLCKKFAEPPAFLCEDGHLICMEHMDQLSNCPSTIVNVYDRRCERQFTSARPLFYEYLFAYSTIECKNKNNGCNVSMLGGQKARHEKTCEFGNRRAEAKECDGVPKLRDEKSPDSISEEETLIEVNKQDSPDIEGVLDSEVSINDSEKGVDNFKASVDSDSLYKQSGFRFDGNDVDFIAKNWNKIEMLILEIPSVKKKQVAKKIAQRELNRFRSMVEDAVLMKSRRGGQSASK